MKHRLPSLAVLILLAVALRAQNSPGNLNFQRGLEAEAQEYYAHAGRYYDLARTEALAARDTLAVARATLRAGVCDIQKFDYPNALRRLPEAAEVFRRLKGDADPEYADVLYRLGVANAQKGFMDLSNEYFRQALRIFEQAGNAFMVFKCHAQFGYNAYGVKEKLMWVEKALALWPQVPDKTPLEEFRLYQQLVFAYGDLGLLDKKEAAAEHAKKLLLQADSNSVQWMIAAAGLAFLMPEEERERIYGQAARCYQNKLGPRSIRYAQLLELLAANSQPDNYDDLLGEALAIYRDSMPGDSLRIAQVMSMKASILFIRDPHNPERAPLIMDNIRILEKIYGPSAFALAQPYTSLGLVYSNKYSCDTALIYFNKALHIAEQTVGQHSVEYAYILAQMATCLSVQSGNQDTAVTIHRRTIRIIEDEAGPGSCLLGSDNQYFSLASRLMEDGRFEEAFDLFWKNDSLITACYLPLNYRLGNLLMASVCLFSANRAVKAKEVGEILLSLIPPDWDNAYKHFFLAEANKVLHVSYDMLGQRDSARFYLAKFLEFLRPENPDYANIFLGAADFYAKDYDWTQYEYYLGKAGMAVEEQSRQGTLHPLTQLRYMQERAMYFFRTGQCDSAMYHARDLNTLAQTVLKNRPQELSGYQDFDLNYSWFCEDLDLDSFILRVKERLNRNTTLYPPGYQMLVLDQQMLASLYALKGDVVKSRYYAEKALAGFRQDMDANAGAVPSELKYLEAQGDFLKANQDGRGALAAYRSGLEKALAIQDWGKARAFANRIAVYHHDNKDYTAAAAYYRQQLEMFPSRPDRAALSELASAQVNLGKCLTVSGHAADAAPLFRSAAAIADTLADNAASKSEIYQGVAWYHAQTGRFADAENILLRAIALFGPEKPETSGDVLRSRRLAWLYNELARCRRQWYAHSRQKATLRAASSAAATMLGHVGAFEHLLGESPDNALEGRASVAAYYHEALLVAHEAGIAPDSLFVLYERGKAGALRALLQEKKARDFSGISKELLRNEHLLDQQIANVVRTRFEWDQGRQRSGLPTQPILTEELNVLQAEKGALVREIRDAAPQYYQLVYGAPAVTLPDVQQRLAPDQAMLQYSVGDSSIFCLFISKQEVLARIIPIDFPLEDWSRMLREEAKKSAGRMNADLFVPAATGLYQRLLALFSALLPERLVIVADGPLYQFPFELLLKKTPDVPVNFARLDYLLQSHSVSCASSAFVWKEMQDRVLPVRDARHRILAIAPEYTGREDYVAFRGSEDADEERKGFSPLKHNQPEADTVLYIWDGQGATIKAGAATEDTIRAAAPQYDIIHHAGHAKAYDRKGNFSFIAFTERPDTLENERLYALEIYGMTLPSEMVVLSGCETGLGNLAPGEGIVGLGRSLAYAGAKSVVLSLWSVQDESTKDFMAAFYGHLKSGLTKDRALRRAKLDFLNAGGAPVQWATFLIWGDCRPIKY